MAARPKGLEPAKAGRREAATKARARAASTSASAHAGPGKAAARTPPLVLIDAGPLIALFDASDRHHRLMLRFLRAQPMRFASTLPVLTEVAHMLDFNVNAQLDFFRWVNAQGVLLVDIGQSDMARVIALTEKYADRPMDFADASLVIAAEKTGIRSIVSLDTDFDVYRVTGREALSNLWTSGATARRRS